MTFPADCGMIFLGEAIRGPLGGLLLSSGPSVAFFVDPLRPFIKLPQCAERFSVSSRLERCNAPPGPCIERGIVHAASIAERGELFTLGSSRTVERIAAVALPPVAS